MEPGGPSPAERLITDLNDLRRDAGSPSLNELVRLSERALARSTLHEHLAGQRSGLPPWRLVAAYVTACHAAASATGLDVVRLGSLEDWHARWVAASGKARTVESPILRGSSGPPGEADQQMPSSQTGQIETVASGSVAPVIKQLEEDLSRLGNTLSSNTALLVVTSGPTVGMRFLIEHHVTTIGRDPESDIWLNDPAVSRSHAIIFRRGDVFLINDSGSRNGVFVRGQAIDAEARLSVYDEIRISIFGLMFLQGGHIPKRSPQSYQPVRTRLVKDISASTAEFRAFAQVVEESSWPTKPVSRGFLRMRRPSS